MAQASSGPERFEVSSRLFGAVCWIVMLAVILTSGCDRGNARSSSTQSSAKQPAEKATIITTVYPLADAARRVAGSDAQLEWVLEHGQSLSAVEVTPELRGRLSLAELVIAGGVNEPWAVEGFDQPYRAPHILRLDFMPSAKASGATSLLWLNPAIVKDAMRELVGRIALFHPQIPEDELRRNEQEFAGDLDKLVAEMRPRIDRLPNKKVLALGDDFTALTGPYGLQEFRPVLTAPTSLGDDDVRHIRETIRTQGLRSALVLDELPPAVIDDLGKRLGVEVLPIDALGTSAPSGHNTYLSLLRFNLEQLGRIR